MYRDGMKKSTLSVNHPYDEMVSEIVTQDSDGHPELSILFKIE